MQPFNTVNWDDDGSNKIFQELFKKKKKSQFKKAKNKLKHASDKKISMLTKKLKLTSNDTINLINTPGKKLKQKQNKQTKNLLNVSEETSNVSKSSKKQKKYNSLHANLTEKSINSIKKVKNRNKKLKNLPTTIKNVINSNVQASEIVNLVKTPNFNKNKNKKDSLSQDLISASNEVLTSSKKRRMRKLKKQKSNDNSTEQFNKSNILNQGIKENTKLKISRQEKNSGMLQDTHLKETKKKPHLKNKLKESSKLKTIPKNANKLKNEFEKQVAKINKKNCLIPPETLSGISKDKKKEKFLKKLQTVLKEVKEPKQEVSLRQRMMEKLKAARFRFINEQIYTTDSKEAQKIFKDDPGAFKAYHDGYRNQVKKWPLNPLDEIIKSIKKMPKTHVIADFGCGDARLSKSVDQKVHSFDLVAVDDTVIECDMSKVPLDNNSVEVAVFCLSLMGKNLRDYLLEANRVLKHGGILKIAEVESRFGDVDDFIKGVSYFGFKNISKDLSNNLFYFLDFKKENPIKHKKKLPTISLLPCLYKKR